MSAVTPVGLHHGVRRCVRPVLSFFGLGILVVLIWNLGPVRLWHIFLSLSPVAVVLVLCAWVCHLLVASARLRLLLKNQVRFHSALHVYLSSFLLNYASMVQGAGQGAKVALLRLRGLADTRTSLTGAACETALDLLYACLVTGLFLMVNAYDARTTILGTVAWRRVSPWLIPGMILLLLLIFYLCFSGRVRSLLTSLRAMVLSPAVCVPALVQTVIAQLAAAFASYVLFQSAGAPAPFFYVLAAHSIAFVLGIVSLVPGGIGVREGISTVVYGAIGIDPAVVVSVVLFNRLSRILVASFLLVVTTAVARSNTAEHHAPGSTTVASKEDAHANG